MRALSSTCCTDVRLYTLRKKKGTNQRALRASSRIVEFASVLYLILVNTANVHVPVYGVQTLTGLK